LYKEAAKKVGFSKKKQISRVSFYMKKTGRIGLFFDAKNTEKGEIL